MRQRVANNSQRGPVRAKKANKAKKQNWLVPGTVKMYSQMPTACLRPLILSYQGVLNGATNIGVRFNPNAAYQPRVGGPTAITPGFPVMATQYGFYRIVEYDYNCTFSCNDTLGCTVFMLNMNNDPGVTPQLALTQNPFSQRKKLSAKGGQDRAILSRHVNICQVLGSFAPMYADSGRSLITTVPADLFWTVVCVQSDSSALTNGVYFDIQLVMHVLWYDRLPL